MLDGLKMSCIELSIILFSITHVFAGNGLTSQHLNSVTAFTGKHFHEFLNKFEYFKHDEILEGVDVKASINGSPDLPHWLRIDQQDNHQDAVLYGTPGKNDVGTVFLKVVARNKATYETVRKKVVVNIIGNGQKEHDYEFEFKIVNKDIIDMFNKTKSFLNAVKSFWPFAKDVTLIEKPSQRKNGSKKPPGLKEGAFVRVGGTESPTTSLQLLHTICFSIPSNNRIRNRLLDSDFDIDWCESKMTSLIDVKDKKNFKDSDRFHETLLQTEVYSITKESYAFDLVYMFIPLILGVIFLVILSCTLCIRDDNVRYFTQLSVTDDSIKTDSINLKDIPESSTQPLPLPYSSHEQRRDVPTNHQRFTESNSRPPPYRVPPPFLSMKASPNHYTIDTNF